MEQANLRVILFFVFTALLIFISRRSLSKFHSHGFFRFFAWESVLALILLNLPFWFNNALIFRQLVSWVLLVSSLAVLTLGVALLKRFGKQSSSRNDPTLYQLERTSVLIKSGIYRYIRHPLYASLLFLAWGAFLKDISISSALLVGLSTIFLVLTAKAEERECMQYFGAEYQEYMQHTKMFIPFLL